MGDKVHFSELGLANTREMFRQAMAGGYAIPAYNFNNLEQLQAIVLACAETASPVIVQVSKGARSYANETMLRYMALGAVKMAREMGSNIPIALHLVQFVVLDQYLSHQFMRWPCISPNYFHEVDRKTWAWNWSPAGKVANGALVTGAIVAAGLLGWSWVVPSAVSLAVIGLKIWTIGRLASLPAPEPWLPPAGRR